jgi:hypothetical protein
MAHARSIFAASIVVAVAASLACVAGCGGGSGGGSHSRSDGILWLSWTVRGAAVSDATCSGIDHLELTMQTAAGTVSIEPIPCLRGLGWEYDNLPEGDNFVILDGLDSRGFTIVEGSSPVTLTATKPPTPAPIDLVTR